ncbi:MAG: phytanoyl-CoA dioxygenase family protein, partial [Actinomycetota bacterium]|nr:phytanoyl-CoA dioxygenase family protein [Actinomycetota bacterium]
MLSSREVDSYNEHGYVRIPGMFTAEETEELAQELDRLIDVWATDEFGWTGGWRQALMDPDVDRESKLVTLHDLQLYSGAWARAVCHPRLSASLADLLGSAVEFHHSTMHVKPPETGQPFPLHQDWPFYPHSDGRYVGGFKWSSQHLNSGGVSRWAAASASRRSGRCAGTCGRQVGRPP